MLSTLFRTRQTVPRAIKSKTICVNYGYLPSALHRPRVSQTGMITDILPDHQYFHIGFHQYFHVGFASSLLELGIIIIFLFFFSHKHIFHVISLQKTGTKSKVKNTTERWREEKAYGNHGNAHNSLRDLLTDIDYHERQLKIARELGDRAGEGNANGNLGNAHHSLGDFRTAIDYYTRSLKIAKELGDTSLEGKSYGSLGNVHSSLGDFKTAIDYHERHLKIARELGERSGEGHAYGSLGIAHRSLGDFKTAIDYHERHLKIARELGDRSGVGHAYGSLGIAHRSLADFKTAIDYHGRQLKIARELVDRSGEGHAYGGFGIAHRSLGDFKTAIDYHERYLKIARELGERSGEGHAYGGLGITHRRLGDLKTAIDYLKRHLKIAIELGDRSGEGNAYNNLGNAYYSLGDFRTAKDYLTRSLKIAKELGGRSQEGKSYGNLGNVHSSLGDFKTAIDYHERHLKIARELGDRSGEGHAYDSLGIAHRNLGDFKTAIGYHERHLKIAIELGDRSAEGGTYGNLAKAHYSLGDLKIAIDYHERCLKIAKELNDKLGEALGCFNLGFDFQCLNKVPVAIEYYQLSITLFNDIRDSLQLNDELKISIRDHDRYQKAYAALWRLMLAYGKVTEALFYAEQGRAQGLKDLMALNYAYEVNDFESVKENGTFCEVFSSFPLNTIFMAIGLKEVIFWVCQKGKDVKVRKKQIISLDEIKTVFQSLVDKIGSRNYVECEDRSLGWAKDKRLTFERSPQDDRQTQHLQLQEEALRTLYDTLFDPIQDLFSGSELVFIPEGPLCLAPFAAFKSPDSKYLCESFRIRVSPSLTCLKMISDCPENYHRKSSVLLVGDPLVKNLSPLPCAREEVNMIGKMVGSTPLVGRHATKDEVLRRLGSVALVHIAAHGDMKTGEIALAPKSGEEKVILTMKDVKQVQLRARLVVLSCCHSAQGEIKAEGVVGIARAFLGAGARSVLVSLWAIEDKATLEFMKNFYQHLVAGKSASEALNRAMNCMRESTEFRDVTHWAPFVLIGDDITLEFDGGK